MSEKDVEYLNSKEKFRRVNLIGGKYKTVDTAALVGYCHNKAHKGFLTVTIMNQHECIAKECHHFEKIEEYPFWQKYYRKEEHKQIKKMKEQRRKENAKKQVENIEKRDKQIIECAYKIAKKFKVENFKITSIRKNGAEYTVFYISNKPINDQHDFCGIAIEMKKELNKKFKFKHIKTTDGKYATI